MQKRLAITKLLEFLKEHLIYFCTHFQKFQFFRLSYFISFLFFVISVNDEMFSALTLTKGSIILCHICCKLDFLVEKIKLLHRLRFLNIVSSLFKKKTYKYKTYKYMYY